MSNYSEPNFPAIFTENQANLRQLDKDLMQSLGNWSLVLKAILDKGLSLADNVDADEVSFTSNAIPDTEDAIAHALGKVPTYFIVGDINKAGVVYRGATAFTKTHVYLKTSVASAAVKLILI